MEITMFCYIGQAVGPSPADAYIDEVARAHADGFARIWTAQLPWDPDLLTMLAAALREVPDIEAGSAVLPIHTAHPMLTAQRALTLNLMSGGRFKLGLGVSHPGTTDELWGIPFDKPVRRMSEYLDGLLPLLAGERADAVGELVTTRGALQIAGAPTPEVYIAALGPQMLQLAGRRTAGTITWMTGPKTLAQHIGPTLREAAAAAGRPQGSVKVVAPFPICVTDDIDATRAQAAKEFKLYGTLPSYRAMLDREGYNGPEDVALIGDEATVSDRIDELRDAGVDEFGALFFGDDEEARARTRALVRKLDGTG